MGMCLARSLKSNIKVSITCFLLSLCIFFVKKFLFIFTWIGLIHRIDNKVVVKKMNSRLQKKNLYLLWAWVIYCFHLKSFLCMWKVMILQLKGTVISLSVLSKVYFTLLAYSCCCFFGLMNHGWFTLVLLCHSVWKSWAC